MSLVSALQVKEKSLAVIGLGYVGLPLAAAYARQFNVVGFDVNQDKIAAYKAGRDSTAELGEEALKNVTIHFTTDETQLRAASFLIVAVPTPINGDKTPDLLPVRSASEVVGRNLQPGSIVVFESTVYPGVTEEICRPILEKESGLLCGRDFKIGYSPERINPGDRVHRLTNIRKIVSGMDEESLRDIAAVYSTIIEAGVYPAPTIKIAEAAKLVENAQRDINIAFMNELAMVFDRMDIDTNEVLKAMNTKWNALGFQPGLVGGHCIGIDPYYFIYQAELLGYHSQIIAAGRRVNDGMSQFVAQAIVKKMIHAGLDVCRARIYLLGMTFKEDCPDTRNSRPVDVFHWLQEYGLEPVAVDPVADPGEFTREYGIPLQTMQTIENADCVVFLVAHQAFRRLSRTAIDRMFRPAADGQKRVIVDVKSIFSGAELTQAGYLYWNL